MENAREYEWLFQDREIARVWLAVFIKEAIERHLIEDPTMDVDSVLFLKTTTVFPTPQPLVQRTLLKYEKES